MAGVQKGVSETSVAPDYQVGDTVKHIKYGKGIVKKMELGARDYQVTVAFEGVGTKVMYAAFAKLKKL